MLIFLFSCFFSFFKLKTKAIDMIITRDALLGYGCNITIFVYFHYYVCLFIMLIKEERQRAARECCFKY